MLKAVTTLLIRELVQIHATVTAGREADKRREREREQRGIEERERRRERRTDLHPHAEGDSTWDCNGKLSKKSKT